MNNKEYEKCPFKKCLANFDGDCRQPILKCEAREKGYIKHKSYNDYWDKNKK